MFSFSALGLKSKFARPHMMLCSVSSALILSIFSTRSLSRLRFKIVSGPCYVCAVCLCSKPKLVFPMFGVLPSLLKTPPPKNIPVTLSLLKMTGKIECLSVRLRLNCQRVSPMFKIASGPKLCLFVPPLSRSQRRMLCSVGCSSQLKRLRVYKTFLSLFLLKLLHHRAMSIFLSRVETGVASRDVQKWVHCTAMSVLFSSAQRK